MTEASRITSKSEMTIKTMSRTMKEASGMRTTKRRPYRSLQAPASRAKTIVGTALKQEMMGCLPWIY